MTEMFRKRRSEREVLSNFVDVSQAPKRFHAGKEKTELFLDLLQLEKMFADEEEFDECAHSEEMVNRVMRSLEEEIISTTYSTSFISSNCRDNLEVLDFSNGHGGQTLASDSGICLDDEIRIPPSSVLDLKDDVCQSLKETSKGLSENPGSEMLGQKWYFEKDFENYQEFPVYEDPRDASRLQDFVSQNIFNGIWL